MANVGPTKQPAILHISPNGSGNKCTVSDPCLFGPAVQLASQTSVQLFTRRVYNSQLQVDLTTSVNFVGIGAVVVRSVCISDEANTTWQSIAFVSAAINTVAVSGATSDFGQPSV